MKKRKTYSRIIAVLAIIAVLLVAAILFMGFRYQQETSLTDNVFISIQQQRIEYIPGIRIDGVDVSGMTVEEARGQIAAADPPLLGSVKIVSEELEATLSLDSIIPLRNSEEAIQSAILLGNAGNAEQREADRSNVLNQGGQDFHSEFKYDLSLVRGEAERIAAELSTEAQDARVQIKESPEVAAMAVETEEDSDEEAAEAESEDEVDEVEIEDFVDFIPGVAGNQVNPDDIMNLLQQHLDEGTLAETETIHVPGTEVMPEKTLDAVKENFTLISSTTSSFASGNNDAPNRVFNMQKASDILNGFILEPGEEFSCNTEFGPRSERTGWKAAGAINNGKSVQEVGGGICQVSSTLFNTVLKSDLEVVQRVPHSWPLAYLPAGQDATISTGGPDFVFSNNRSTPVVIIANVDTKAKELTIDIYGEPVADGLEIRLVSEKTGTIGQPKSQTTTDPEAVRKGRSGSTYETYKEYYDGEELVRREFAYDTRYRAFSTITLAGGAATEADGLDLESEGAVSEGAASPSEATPAPSASAPEPTPEPVPEEPESIEDIDLEELIPEE